MNLFNRLPDSWKDLLKDQEELLHKIEEVILSSSINPQPKNIFKAFRVTPDKVKIVIIGQDPYPNKEHADGLAFSIPDNCTAYPGSLRNILREYQDDLGVGPRNNGDLTDWADQGVLLINSILTCRTGESLSHQNIGWEIFIENILRTVVTEQTVAILWGRHAQKYTHYFAPDMVIASTHPSPLSAYRGFFGSKPFSRANDLLERKGIKAIDWSRQSV